MKTQKMNSHDRIIQKLHLQLTALCTVITGLVLTVLTVICLLISEAGIRTQENSAFLTNLNTLYENLELQTVLSHNWLHQMELHYQFTIRLFDNGTPLFYQQLIDDLQTDTLIHQVIRQAKEEFHLDPEHDAAVSSLSHRAEFLICDESGRPYEVSASVFPHQNGMLGAVILHPLADMQSRIRHQRISFALADLFALLALSVFFWFFTARMIRPIQESRQKQIRFVAAASHELRSPLTVMLSNLAAVRSHLLPNDDAFLTMLDSECHRMSRLISDMLQLAGADNHTWSVQFSEAEPDTLLLEVWETFESLALSRDLHFEIELPEERVMPICCDAERIRQLLSILIDNAFSYTPKGGRICLSLATEAPALLSGRSRYADTAKHRRLYFLVSDNGPGIPDEQKAAVFERFFRLDSARSDKSHFGLGLSIAQEIVQLHHGQLLLCDTPGGGATFVIALEYGLPSQ